MYFYLFDSFLQERKYGKIKIKLELKITDLGLEGRIEQLTVLKNLSELISTAVKRGAKTIVAIGNDQTFSKVVESIANLGLFDSVVGFVPIGKSIFAKILGLPPEDLALDVLSSRLIQKIDLGKINNHYFLSSVRITSPKIFLEMEESYKVIPSSQIEEVSVYNFGYFPCPFSQRRVFNPKDGYLEAIITKRKTSLLPFLKGNLEGDSLFFVKKIKIKPTEEEPLPVMLDNLKILKTPLTIEVEPVKLKVIVGKERMF